MLEKVINHLMQNPEEALAIVEGKALPLGLGANEVLDIIRLFNNDSVGMMAGYWT